MGGVSPSARISFRVSRRRFLRTLGVGGVAAGAPVWFAGRLRGEAERPAPSGRITLACIGVGWRGRGNLEAFLGHPDCQVVAVCDVDQKAAATARDLVNRHYGHEDCAVCSDFRELLARRDLDAVVLSLPNHWHAIPAIEAAQRGKDVYGEVPLAHGIREGRVICDVVTRYARVWQSGSWQRSVRRFREAVERVRNGRIGRVHTIEIGLPGGHPDLTGAAGQTRPTKPPAELDYEFWLGPASRAPYCPARLPRNWRWIRAYGGGQLMDWAGHHVDIAHWALDDPTPAPLEVEARGDFPDGPLWDTPTRFSVTARYPNGLQLILAGGYPHLRPGVRWIGDEGWIWVSRHGSDASPRAAWDEPLAPQEFHLPPSPGHYRDFLDAVKTRRLTIAPVEAAQRAATVGHLGLIAMRVGRKIRWDAATENIPDDATARRLLGVSYREPWRL